MIGLISKSTQVPTLLTKGSCTNACSRRSSAGLGWEWDGLLYRLSALISLTDFNTNIR